MATIAELIQLAQDKLAIVLAADPAVYVDYRIGAKEVKKSQYVDWLLKLIEKLSMQVEADFDWATFGLDVSAIGVDLAEYDT
jgi:hypothetical protein